jgi:hypothetical protein
VSLSFAATVKRHDVYTSSDSEAEDMITRPTKNTSTNSNQNAKKWQLSPPTECNPNGFDANTKNGKQEQISSTLNAMYSSAS